MEWHHLLDPRTAENFVLSIVIVSLVAFWLHRRKKQLFDDEDEDWRGD